MTCSAACLVGLLLGCLWVMPMVKMSTPADLCKPMHTLKASLNFTNRRQYMKHNFPINYTIRVHYEEVFRVSNISRLKARIKGVQVEDLQELWLLVNQEVLKKVVGVLPERHPSRRYSCNLEDLLGKVQQVFQMVQDRRDESEPPEQIQEIWERVRDPEAAGWKWVKPKALLDNCYRTMHCLFNDCFQAPEQEDYCDVRHWRKGNKKQHPQA
ncbi:hypothetical protein MATL_G00145770 [Megalops atlanticus]|uniref:Interleukin 34 n=1 Tax=Megalops atlanticus TaxID=7932 RepID=A0A9D3PZG4_MEGAT|nr:hypothetical protein MATL_G00145770 [Megalops atlanticus]